MSEHAYVVVRYASAGEQFAHVYAHLWRARLNARILLARGEVVEVDRTDRRISSVNSQLRQIWREQLLGDPEMLRTGFRRYFPLEYARIAYHVALATPARLRLARRQNRRMAVAITLLPKPLRHALIEAIG